MSKPMFRGRWRGYNYMILEPTKKLKRSFQNLTNNLKALSFVNDLVDHNKCVGYLDTSTGLCANSCQFYNNVIIGGEQCMKCKHYCGSTIKLITTIREDVNSLHVVNCNYTQNRILQILSRIIFRFKKIFHLNIKYKIIFLNDEKYNKDISN